MSATHKEKEVVFHGKTIVLKPGQLITGRKILSQETGISESNIERTLKVFQNEQQIEQETNSRNRIITILSWDLYQNSEQQTNSKRTANEQQTNTNKKKERIDIVTNFYKEEIDKNIEKDKIKFYKSFANFLFKANPSGKPIYHIIKIEHQVDYEDFCKLFEKVSGNMQVLFDKLAAMMNDASYTKRKTYLFLTLNDWINRDAKRK